MKDTVLRDRQSALEREFFGKLDEKLWQKLREKKLLEKQEKALAEATGISDKAVLAELMDSGIGTETVYALSLLPLVWVAWADNQMARNEREAILKAAEQTGLNPDSASHQLIEAWLAQKPSEDLLEAWKGYVQAIGQIVSPEAKAILKKDVVQRARQVAEAAGGLLGIAAVSKAEESVLAQVEQAFTN